MKFKPRRQFKIDEQISKILKSTVVTIPILNIRQNIFVIGPKKVNMDEKQGKVVVKPIGMGGAGSSQEKLEVYIQKYQDDL